MIQLTMQPQEIEVWYVLPALRRELAKVFLAEGLSQRRIAELLNITEAAVSQYLHSKRAQKVMFTPEFEEKIKKVSEKVVTGQWTSYEALLVLCQEFRESKELCALHHELEKVPRECDLCLEGQHDIKA